MLRIRKFESGQVVALVAGAIFVIIAMAALAVDIGSLYATRRNMQTAADAAAIAGSNAVEQACGTTSGCSCSSVSACTSAAADVATLNGYTNGGANGMTVTVGAPATPPNPSNGIYVQVSVAEAVPTYFMRVLGFSTVNVGATAVAGYAPTPNCVTILAPTAQNAFVASGGSDFKANCGVAVDSDSTSGLVVSGGSTLTAGSVGVVASSESQAGSGVTPAYVPNIAPVPDPLHYLVTNGDVPTVAACTASTGSSGSKGKGYTSTGGDTISQGTYCGGITVSGGKSLNLNPGTYVLLGGGLQVNGSSNLVGTGVTFFNTVWTSGDPTADNVGNAGQYKPIVFSGGSSTDLTAPTSGSLNGILFFQDPSLPSGDLNQQNTISGTSTATFDGALYFPTTPLVFSGGSSTTPENVDLVAFTLTVSGGSAYLGGGATGGAGQTPAITVSRLYE